MHVRPRSYSYALASVLLALVIGWVGRNTWQELRHLNRSFASVQGDGFHLSEQIEASVRELNDIVLRFDLHRKPVDGEAFQKQSQDLKLWIREHQATVSTPPERELMAEILTAFDDYFLKVSQLMGELLEIGTTPPPQPTSERLGNQAALILDLCEKLKAVERSAQKEFLEDSHRALGWVQQLLIGLLVLLAVLLGTVAVALYRGVIGPLRVELGESRAIAARHEKLASLGTLAAGVAHEIRNPLTAINVRVHGLKKSLQVGTSEHEDITVIDEEIRRLDGIVGDFLDFARPSEPRLVTIAVGMMFSRVQSLLSPQWKSAAIRFNVEPPPTVWVRVDPHQLEQVLINLLQNAADSIEERGTITLRARALTTRLGGRSIPAVVAEVVDSGKGIPPEAQKRIFDPFFTTKESGTGLGLAIAASIVAKHGGVLQYRTQVGRGTTFGIVLPRAEPND